MRRLLVLGLSLVFAACSSQPPKMVVPAPAPPPPAEMPAPPRGVTDAAVAIAPDAGPPPLPFRTGASGFNVDPNVAGTGKTYMVATEDEYATKAGVAVLASGGNAVDAAVASAFVLAVTLPSAGNIGGGGFAVVRSGKNKIAALDFRETAPAAASPDMYKDDPKSSLAGYRASGVPGSVAGLEALHKKYGKKKWKELLAPAIKLARDGYVINAHVNLSIVLGNRVAPMSGNLAAIYLPNGKAVETGATVKNPELADALQLIADKGSAGFYKGTTAKAIATAMKANGGLITEKDLAGYKVVWREPLKYTYRGKTLYTMPLPSSGGMVLALTANMLRGIDLAKLGWHSTQHVHWLTEVWRRGYAARNLALGDPAYVKDMPIARLTSQAEADRLVATITERATPSKDVPPLIEGKHTTHFNVVDAKGMAVALTTTLNTGFGSGVMINGIIMNNEMDDFATIPGQPNAYGLVQGEANKIEPGKRMLSSMSPTIIEDDKGELYMVVGAEGGSRIITAVWQTLSNVIDYGMSIDQAIAAPRIHHQHLPDDVVFDDEAITADVDAELDKLGYVRVWNQRSRIFSSATGIVKTPAGWAGAADPRRGGAALGD
ncbi:MAG TPA: gamma-glutamyltransferase [Kofleriaceae bacterium]|nr:gamma-glutamyltransferase [Kofleriaceae bacterium]